MKNKKMILSLLLISFCISVLFRIRKQVKKVDKEEEIIREFELANDHLDQLLIKSCHSIIDPGSNLLSITPEIKFIITEFDQKIFKTLVKHSGHDFALIRMRSTNPVLIKYDVSALSVYLFLKRDNKDKIINCYGKSFHQ